MGVQLTPSQSQLTAAGIWEAGSRAEPQKAPDANDFCVFYNKKEAFGAITFSDITNILCNGGPGSGPGRG